MKTTKNTSKILNKTNGFLRLATLILILYMLFTYTWPIWKMGKIGSLGPIAAIVFVLFEGFLMYRDLTKASGSKINVYFDILSLVLLASFYFASLKAQIISVYTQGNVVKVLSIAISCTAILTAVIELINAFFINEDKEEIVEEEEKEDEFIPVFDGHSKDDSLTDEELKEIGEKPEEDKESSDDKSEILDAGDKETEERTAPRKKIDDITETKKEDQD